MKNSYRKIEKLSGRYGSAIRPTYARKPHIKSVLESGMSKEDLFKQVKN